MSNEKHPTDETLRLVLSADQGNPDDLPATETDGAGI